MINIATDYAIKADEKQYILIRKVLRENKQTKELLPGKDTLGYYTTVDGALRGLIQRLHREQVRKYDMTVGEAAQVYKEARDAVMEWWDSESKNGD